MNDVQEDLNTLSELDNPTSEQIAQVAEETLKSLPDAGEALQQAAESAAEQEAGNTDQTPMPTQPENGDEPAGDEPQEGSPEQTILKCRTNER